MIGCAATARCDATPLPQCRPDCRGAGRAGDRRRPMATAQEAGAAGRKDPPTPSYTPSNIIPAPNPLVPRARHPPLRLCPAARWKRPPPNPPAMGRPKNLLSCSPAAARAARRHIGVLKVLEELRVPVDRIAGTNARARWSAARMTSGMSISDMEELVGGLSTAPSSRSGRRAAPGSPQVGLTTPTCYARRLGVRSDGSAAAQGARCRACSKETVLLEAGQHPAGRTSIPAADSLPRRRRSTLVAGTAVVFTEGELARRDARQPCPYPAPWRPPSTRAAARRWQADRQPRPWTWRAPWAPTSASIVVNLGTPLMKREDLTSPDRRDQPDAEHPDRAERAQLAGVAAAHGAS